MTDKEKFLSIQTYEEFDKRRGEFKELSMADEEIREHVGKIFPKLKNYSKEEAYRTPLLEQCKNCSNWRGFNGCRLYPHVLKEFPAQGGKEISCQYRKERI